MFWTACSTYLIDLTMVVDHIDLQMVDLLVFFGKNNQMMSFGLNLLLLAGIAHMCLQRNTNLFVCQTDLINLTKDADRIDSQMVALLVVFGKNNQKMSFGLNLLLVAGLVHICQ